MLSKWILISLSGVFGGNYHTHNTLHLPPGLDVVCYSNGPDYARGFRYAVQQAQGTYPAHPLLPFLVLPCELPYPPRPVLHLNVAWDGRFQEVTFFSY